MKALLKFIRSIFMATLALFAILFIICLIGQPWKSQIPSYPKPINDGRQIEREDLIFNMKQAGIINKIDTTPEGLHITVGPAFALLSFDKKTSAADVITTYYSIEAGFQIFCVLHDYYSAKIIGTYTPRSGLKLK